MKLLITIVPKGKSDLVAKIIHQGMIHFQTTMIGKGTAPTEIADILWGDTEKEVLFSVIDDQDVRGILEDINEAYDFEHSHFGVAFAIDIDSIGKMGYDFLYEAEEVRS